MAERSYERGLRQVGTASFAFLQPDGGWGWSNAGLVAGERESLLIDTFFDLPKTRELLASVETVTPAPVRTLVNTHHNGDHVNGNQLVTGATIIGHRRCREEMVRAGSPRPRRPEAGGEEHPAAAYTRRAFSAFDFSGITATPPDVVFDEELTVYVDGREVRLLHFGPCHTLGDIAVWLPDERLLYSGDLLFLGSTPLVWEGSLGNWIDTCDRLLGLEPEIVVPGHGPVTDPDGIRQMQAYLQLVVAYGRELKEQGLEPLEAARRFDPGPYRDWLDSERIVLNFMRLWLELDGRPPTERVSTAAAFAGMAALKDG